jgi:hypothetical protein
VGIGYRLRDVGVVRVVLLHDRRVRDTFKHNVLERCQIPASSKLTRGGPRQPTIGKGRDPLRLSERLEVGRGADFRQRLGHAWRLPP